MPLVYCCRTFEWASDPEGDSNDQCYTVFSSACHVISHNAQIQRDLPSLRMCSLTDQSENTYTEHRNSFFSLINQSHLSCRKAVRHGLVGCLNFCICIDRARGDHQLQPSKQRVFPPSYNPLHCLYQTSPPISPPISHLSLYIRGGLYSDLYLTLRSFVYFHCSTLNSS